MPSVFVFSNLILLPRAYYHSMSFYEVQKVYDFPIPSLAITAKINSEQQCFLQIWLNEALYKTDKVPEKSHSLYVEKEKTGEYMYMWTTEPVSFENCLYFIPSLHDYNWKSNCFFCLIIHISVSLYNKVLKTWTFNQYIS